MRVLQNAKELEPEYLACSRCQPHITGMALRRALATVETCGPTFKMMDTSFFLARQTLHASSRPGMAIWREKLFAWMLRNAESAMEFFKLPTNRVVELGSQVEI